jgi:hypothetical protein
MSLVLFSSPSIWPLPVSCSKLEPAAVSDKRPGLSTPESMLLGGNRHPTIPHSFKDDPRLGSASAYTQQGWGNCSRLYEVKFWTLLQGQPLDGVHSRVWKNQECVRESRIRAAETRSCTGKRPGLGMPAAAAAAHNDHTAYHIMYDSNV